MSAPQGSYGCRITVTTSDADVLRAEAKKVLMFNHEEFEDFLDYVPVKQLALADIFRDATAVIDALGWDPRINPPRTTFNVPLTHGHIQQLHKQRTDLLDHNLDLISDIGADRDFNTIITSEIHNNRHSVEALNRIFDAYANTIAE
jgi:hypothetical protein